MKFVWRWRHPSRDSFFISCGVKDDGWDFCFHNRWGEISLCSRSVQNDVTSMHLNLTYLFSSQWTIFHLTMWIIYCFQLQDIYFSKITFLSFITQKKVFCLACESNRNLIGILRCWISAWKVILKWRQPYRCFRSEKKNPLFSRSKKLAILTLQFFIVLDTFCTILQPYLGEGR